MADSGDGGLETSGSDKAAREHIDMPEGTGSPVPEKADKSSGSCKEEQGVELRSSSGECTSGESNTDKAPNGTAKQAAGSERARKEEHHQPHNPAVTAPQALNAAARRVGQKSGARDEEGRQGSQETDNETIGSLNNRDKPKLPRPATNPNCPRCSSAETKFCYYNNYNIKQPRYFCRSCQRYWTAGGTLRNVPVGAGRRKNKSAVARDHDKGIALADVSSIMPGSAFGQLSSQYRPLLEPALSFGSGGKAPQFGGHMAGACAGPSLSHMSHYPAAVYSGSNGPTPVACLPAGGAAITDSRQSTGATHQPTDAYLNTAAFLGTGCKDEGGGGDARRVRQRVDDPDRATSEHAYLGGLQPYHQAPASGAMDSFSGLSSQSDWMNLAAAAGQQQAAQHNLHHAQQQLQQAMHLQQAQALQAAAAGWNQNQNPFLAQRLSGLYMPSMHMYGAQSMYGAQGWGGANTYAGLNGAWSMDAPNAGAVPGANTMVASPSEPTSPQHGKEAAEAHMKAAEHQAGMGYSSWPAGTGAWSTTPADKATLGHAAWNSHAPSHGNASGMSGNSGSSAATINNNDSLLPLGQHAKPFEVVN